MGLGSLCTARAAAVTSNSPNPIGESPLSPDPKLSPMEQRGTEPRCLDDKEEARDNKPLVMRMEFRQDTRWRLANGSYTHRTTWI